MLKPDIKSISVNCFYLWYTLLCVVIQIVVYSYYRRNRSGIERSSKYNHSLEHDLFAGRTYDWNEFKPLACGRRTSFLCITKRFTTWVHAWFRGRFYFCIRIIIFFYKLERALSRLKHEIVSELNLTLKTDKKVSAFNFQCNELQFEFNIKREINILKAVLKSNNIRLLLTP